jgi:hypothetical protein
MVHNRIGVKRGVAPCGRCQARQGYAGDAYGMCGNATIQLLDMRGAEQARDDPRNVIISIDIALKISEALKIEKKKSRKVLAEQPPVVDGAGSSNFCQLVEIDSSE